MWMMNEKQLSLAEEAFADKYPEFASALERYRWQAASISGIDTVATRYALSHFQNGYIAGHNNATLVSSAVPDGYCSVPTITDNIELQSAAEALIEGWGSKQWKHFHSFINRLRKAIEGNE